MSNVSTIYRNLSQILKKNFTFRKQHASFSGVWFYLQMLLKHSVLFSVFVIKEEVLVNVDTTPKLSVLWHSGGACVVK